MKKIKLGDLLVAQNVISDEQLNEALSVQKRTGQKLGDVLAELELISSNDLLMFLAKQMNLPFLDLKSYSVKFEIVKLVPETFSRRFKMVPIDCLQEQYWIAASDPTDIFAFDQISSKLNQPARMVVVREEDLIDVLDEVYKSKDDIQTFVGELEQEMKQVSKTELQYEEILEDTPLKRLLNSIFEEAIQNKASDIHIEPDVNYFRIRQRIDGVLNEQIIEEKSILAPLILRIKLLAGLNISEHRLPQDGRFSIQFKGRKVDVRVATMPLEGSESVVLRILDPSTGVLQPEELGMTDRSLRIFRKHLNAPHGMILVTGPTGSGKTTTLYSALSALNTIDKKIITVEDPIEYTLERVNQVQVQNKIGLDFSTILRSALRHDPDVVMVGEIRDNETARIALRAAMTGHLVFSTLHTNDAITAPVRLMDMGIPAYLAASSLSLVIAQRLLKKICQRCQIDYNPTEKEQKFLSNYLNTLNLNGDFKIGKGCKHCNMTGFSGRVGIYEMLEINQEISESLRANNINQYFENAVTSTTYQSLLYSAAEYVNQGLTSLTELFRLNFEIEMENFSQDEKVLLPEHQSKRNAS